MGIMRIRNVLRVCKQFWRVIEEHYWETWARRKWDHCDVSKYGYDWRALCKDNNAESLRCTFTWSVTNFSKLPQQKMYSSRFTVGGYPWYIALYPKGNHDPTCLAMYLQPGETTVFDARKRPKMQDTEYPWRMATMWFTLVHPHDRQQDHTRFCEHLYDCGEPDWGYTSFMRFEDLDKKGLVHNDTLVLCTKVSVTPYREPGDLDIDDMEAIDIVAATTSVKRAAARQAYVHVRGVSNKKPMYPKFATERAIAYIRKNPDKFSGTGLCLQDPIQPKVFL